MGRCLRTPAASCLMALVYIPCLHSQRVDIGLWTDTVADLACCLRKPDIEDVRSASYSRCAQLVTLLEQVFVLKVLYLC